jgi:hypothetical protein
MMIDLHDTTLLDLASRLRGRELAQVAQAGHAYRPATDWHRRHPALTAPAIGGDR